MIVIIRQSVMTNNATLKVALLLLDDLKSAASDDKDAYHKQNTMDIKFDYFS